MTVQGDLILDCGENLVEAVTKIMVFIKDSDKLKIVDSGGYALIDHFLDLN